MPPASQHLKDQFHASPCVFCVVSAMPRAAYRRILRRYTSRSAPWVVVLFRIYAVGNKSSKTVV